MEALLIDEWVPDEDAILVIDEASVVVARQHARETAQRLGMSVEDSERLAAIAAELGMNQVRHAGTGRIAIRTSARGVEIVAADRGRGIADIPSALAGVPRPTGSLGVGIAAVREHADEVDFDVRLGEGTCIAARKLLPGVPRMREIGIFGRPYPGEPRSGDHAAVRRDERSITLALCDGLGHGVAARQASGTAIDAFQRSTAPSPTAMLEDCHEAVGPTRGGVMAIARIESGNVEVASIGNITVEIVAPRKVHRFGGSSFVLGSPQRGRKTAADSRPIADDASLVLFTDGLGTRLSIEEELLLLRQHPIAIAYELVSRYAKDHDDALVIVVR